MCGEKSSNPVENSFFTFSCLDFFNGAYYALGPSVKLIIGCSFPIINSQNINKLVYSQIRLIDSKFNIIGSKQTIKQDKSNPNKTFTWLQS